MKEYIAFDSHKHYALMERGDAQTGRTVQQRIEHQRGALCAGLRQCPAHQTVAVEATGNWYWIIGEIEQAGHQPVLVHPRKSKMMMGQINKTDKLDVHGLNRLQRNGTLSPVWIPPAELRDQRELTRTRLTMVAARARLKSRLNATLSKYGFSVTTSDPFGQRGREQWNTLLPLLPPQTRFVVEQLLQQVDFLDNHVELLEKRFQALLKVTPMMQRLQTLPGIGLILSATIALEIGYIHRFASHEHLASYAGTTPRIHSSGDKTRYGRLH